MKVIKHKLSRITDKIFALEIPNDWDRCMVFLRAQEFYESSSTKFKGKDFDIWDYMKWYAYERLGANATFSYTNDWAAFNLPIKTIVKCLDKQTTPLTPYDIFMDEILHKIFNKYDTTENDTYLIGVDKLGDASLNVKHEMSHALWYTNPEYKKRANAILKQISKDSIERAKTKLIQMGYAKEVLLDEIFAYSATGEMARLTGDKEVANLYQQACIDLLEEFLPKSKKLKAVA